MERKSVPFDYKLNKTLDVLTDMGLLLAGTKQSGESNAMTIGWGTIGNIWGVPMFVVLVRPSRYTYEFIEDSGEFTVNVPTEAMRKWVGVCGSRSGRDLDKFAEYDQSTSPGQKVDVITIDDCPMVYECKVIHHNDLIPGNLSPEAESRFYGGEDYHRVYFGQIVASYASDDF